MLKLLIADDEKYDRESIKSILGERFKSQLELHEAKNGREAIEISELIRPYIIIMDIKMPGINGVKAIQEIRKFLPNSYIIILTAYDYFDFAVEAVKNNVKEYILKPFTKAELIEKIDIAIAQVEREIEIRRKEIENQEKLYNMMPILENELGFSIINNITLSVEHETYRKYLGIDFENVFSMVIKIDDELAENLNDDKRVEQKLKIGEYIREYIFRRFKCFSSYRFTEELIYFVKLEQDIEEEKIKHICKNLAEHIIIEVKRNFNINLKVGIGKCYSGFENLNKGYIEANQALSSSKENNEVTYFEKQENGTKEKVALFKAVEKYITENMKEELDLEKIASKFNLSSFYFSRTFKEVVGHNFSDYINIIRIKKAKELLKAEEVSIKEVCFLVGYSDPNYFSKVFKKYEGYSPSEFKFK